MFHVECDRILSCLCFALEYILSVQEFPFDHVSYRFVPVSATYPAELELTEDLSSDESSNAGLLSTRNGNAQHPHPRGANDDPETPDENSHKQSNKRNGSRKKHRRKQSNSKAKRSSSSSWDRRNGAGLQEEDSTLLLGNGGSDYSDLDESEFGDLLDADDLDEVLHGIGDVTGTQW